MLRACRCDFHHEVGRAPDVAAHDFQLCFRDKQHVRLDDERGIAIENDVERRDKHVPEIALANVGVKHRQHAPDDELMIAEGGRRLAKVAVHQLHRAVGLWKSKVFVESNSLLLPRDKRRSLCYNP